MLEHEVGRHVEKRFEYNRRHYVVSLINFSNGTSVEEVCIDSGLRGQISGVVFDSEEAALVSAHQLARNLIGD